jgi:allophanate hydrolase
MAPAFHDRALLALADRLHRALGGRLGVTLAEIGKQPALEMPRVKEVLLAVVGAHLSGQPLNHQLTSRAAKLVSITRTTPNYRLYALAKTTPPKPGLVRVAEAAGDGIELEVWTLTETAFGSFVTEVPPPMVIGTVTLANGTSVKGFLCEPSALDGAKEITHFGGWRAFLSSAAKEKRMA